MRETRTSGSEGGGVSNHLSLPLSRSCVSPEALNTPALYTKVPKTQAENKTGGQHAAAREVLISQNRSEERN
jgi:hypothetical protein